MTTDWTSSEGHHYTVFAAYAAPAALGTPAGDAAGRRRRRRRAHRHARRHAARGLPPDRLPGRGRPACSGSPATAPTRCRTRSPPSARTAFGRSLVPYWSAIGVHRDAEFNRAHIPAFLAGEEPHKYLCMYPYVRSLEWYLLPEEERREMLAEHGIMGRDYPDVRANTVSSFALGDYEWLLAFEADELTRIVDVMRHLRGAKARAHTREELPFLTGIRKPLTEIAAALG